MPQTAGLGFSALRKNAPPQRADRNTSTSRGAEILFQSQTPCFILLLAITESPGTPSLLVLLVSLVACLWLRLPQQQRLRTSRSTNAAVLHPLQGHSLESRLESFYRSHLAWDSLVGPYWSQRKSPDPTQFIISVENLPVAAFMHRDCYQMIKKTHGERLAVQNQPRFDHWLRKRLSFIPWLSQVAPLAGLTAGDSKRNPKPSTTITFLTTTTLPELSCLFLGFQSRSKLLVTFPSCKLWMQNHFHSNHSTVCSVPRTVSCKQLLLHLLPRKLSGSSADYIRVPTAESSASVLLALCRTWCQVPGECHH